MFLKHRFSIFMKPQQITTVSLFQLQGFRQKWIGFQQMAFWPSRLQDVSGLVFSRLMGVGSGNGFSVFPDFGKFAFLAVWNSAEEADHFFLHHPAWNDYIRNVSTFTTYRLVNTMSHGAWGGANPFVSGAIYDDTEKVAVLTRATIHWKDMVRFWKDVPLVSRSLSVANPPLLALGVGEWPFRFQATFSIWQSGEHMRSYAYQHTAHRNMVEKTRKVGWYKEELFARFSFLE